MLELARAEFCGLFPAEQPFLNTFRLLHRFRHPPVQCPLALLKGAAGEPAGSSAGAPGAGEREARRAAAAESVQSDGFVKDLVNLFDAKVVDSSIKEDRK